MRKFSSLFLILLLIAFSIFSLSPAKAQAAWAPNVAYSVGTLVTYGGHTYKCLQAHTSQVGWEPPNVPALWQDMGVTTGGSTATSVPPTTAPTKTNTPQGPTATNPPATATTNANG